MSSEEIKKAIQDSGLTIDPSGKNLLEGNVGTEGCVLCEATWGCLLGGSCAGGCSAHSGCETGCWLSTCNSDCNAGLCSSCYS
jgi:hypothetical protein